jgi:hypothetical protein
MLRMSPARLLTVQHILIYQTKSILSYTTHVSIPVIFLLAEIPLATAMHNVLCTISGSCDSEVSYCCLLGCDTIHSGTWQLVWTDILIEDGGSMFL